MNFYYVNITPKRVIILMLSLNFFYFSQFIFKITFFRRIEKFLLNASGDPEVIRLVANTRHLARFPDLRDSDNLNGC